jgi:hypothetical protein
VPPVSAIRAPGPVPPSRIGLPAFAKFWGLDDHLNSLTTLADTMQGVTNLNDPHPPLTLLVIRGTSFLASRSETWHGDCLKGFMNCRWSIPGLLVAAALLAPGSADARDKVAWSKTTNFNLHRALDRAPAAKLVNKARAMAPKAIAGKVLDEPGNRILATFPLEEDVPILKPLDPSEFVARPPPDRCEWIRSIVAAYAFENVRSTSCVGSVYSFEAERGERRFLIEASALNGDLLKVERLALDGLAGDSQALELTIEPAGQ